MQSNKWNNRFSIISDIVHTYIVSAVPKPIPPVCFIRYDGRRYKIELHAAAAAAAAASGLYWADSNGLVRPTIIHLTHVDNTTVI